MKIALTILAVVSTAASLSAASPTTWDSLYMIRGGVDILAASPARNVDTLPTKAGKDYRSFLSVRDSGQTLSTSATLTTGFQSGQGFAGSGVRGIR